jgi:hypothetical protein
MRHLPAADHLAQTLETTSIHLTTGSHRSPLDVVHASPTPGFDAEFRKSLPMGIDPADHGTMAAMATKIMTDVADTMRFRAAEVTTAAAARMSQQHAERTRPVPVRPLASMEAAEHAATSTVRWRRGLVANIEHYADRVVLRLPDRTITFPTSCGAAVDALHHGHVADAGSLPGLDRADGTVLIRRFRERSWYRDRRDESSRRVEDDRRQATAVATSAGSQRPAVRDGIRGIIVGAARTVGSMGGLRRFSIRDRRTRPRRHRPPLRDRGQRIAAIRRPAVVRPRRAGAGPSPRPARGEALHHGEHRA